MTLQEKQDTLDEMQALLDENLQYNEELTFYTINEDGTYSVLED